MWVRVLVLIKEMKLNEIESKKNGYLYFEIISDGLFTEKDIQKRLIGVLVNNNGRFRGKGHYGQNGMWYEILYPTVQEAEQGRRILRRLSRGQPRVTVSFVSVSQHSSMPGR